MERILARFPLVNLISIESAELGLELAKSTHLDLILMDINSPGMDGYQALEQLRIDDETRAIPVIALSANIDPFDIEQGQAAGFADYLTKLFNIKQVCEVVSDLLNRSS
jgi:CheY-like chemotaxis protein